MNSEDYGWKPEVSKWYDDVLENIDDANAEVWDLIQRPENKFQTASWWLARKVIIDRDEVELPHRTQIRRLVSKDEARGSFPLHSI